MALRPEPFGALAYHFGTRRLSFLKSRTLLRVVESLSEQPSARAACAAAGVDDAELPQYTRALADARGDGDDPVKLVDHFQSGLDAPICLTWELTYACNLACVHCLSSSGRRDPRELSTAECMAVIDELAADAGLLREHRRRRADGAQGLLGARRLRDGAPRRREVLDQRLADRRRRAPRGCAASDYVDVQISLDGATAAVNDAVRGAGLLRHRDARRWSTWPRRGCAASRLASSITRENVVAARRVQGDRRPLRRAAAAHAAAAVGARRRRLGRAAPDAGPAARRCTTGCSPTARTC